VLAEAAVALDAAGQWAEIVDRNWRLVYTTDDLEHQRIRYRGAW